MKVSLILAALFMTSFAHADLITFHQKEKCGDDSSCRVVVAPKVKTKNGYCAGIFANAFPCIVSFISVAEGAAMNLLCGEDLSNPTINQDMPATGITYNLSTILQNESGKKIVKEDLNEYTLISNRNVDVFFTEDQSDKIKGEVVIHLEKSSLALTRVSCEL